MDFDWSENISIVSLFFFFFKFYFSFRQQVNMPMKKSSKKSYKKRTSTKMVPYKRFPARAYVYSTPNMGLGPSAQTVLRTSFFYNGTAAASGIATGFISPGSAFDPTGGLSTIQPNTFDQFASIYSRYKVNACKIKVTVSGAQGITATSWVMAAYPSVDPIALATYQGAGSQPGSKTISGGFQYGTNGGTSVGTGSEAKHMWFDLKHKAVLGTNVDAYDSGALVTADPTAGQYMVLPFLWQSNVAGVASFVLEIDMWQDVTFLQRKNIVDA